MTLRLRCAARTDRGLVRNGNQDSVYAGPRLVAVADGMGGMAAGDVASSIVITTIGALDQQDPGPGALDALREIVERANREIGSAVTADPALAGMGTTLTGLLLSGPRLVLVHIGDSRAYLLRDGALSQITRDDTFVQLLVDDGHITEAEAQTHPRRFLVTKALQGNEVPAEYTVRQAAVGDRYLVCSDGLSGVVRFDTIEATLLEYPDPDDCAGRLVELALDGGAPDNVTVAIADVTDEPVEPVEPIVAGAAAAG